MKPDYAIRVHGQSSVKTQALHFTGEADLFNKATLIYTGTTQSKSLLGSSPSEGREAVSFALKETAVDGRSKLGPGIRHRKRNKVNYRSWPGQHTTPTKVTKYPVLGIF